MDTGCGHDLISAGSMGNDDLKKASPITFATANGAVTTTTKGYASCEELGEHNRTSCRTRRGYCPSAEDACERDGASNGKPDATRS